MTRRYDCPECSRTLNSERGRRSHRAQVHGFPWQDEDTLQELYVEQGLSMEKIAEELGCAVSVVSRNIRKCGIEPRSKGAHARVPYMPMEMNAYGRMVWRTTSSEDGEKYSYGFPVHRLLAIAIHGPDAVTNDMDVHHKNGIPWDNRPDNIRLLSKADHARLHNQEPNHARRVANE